MQESILPSVPAPATLPSSAASTPTTAQSGYFAHSLAPCDGPTSHMASTGTQRNSTHSDAPGSSLAPSRLRTETAVHQQPGALLAAPPQQHPTFSTVQAEHTGSWHHSAEQTQDAVVSGAPHHGAAIGYQGLWRPQQHSSSSSGNPWIHQDQLYNAAALQQRGLPGSLFVPAEPHAAQQVYTWQQQQQLQSPTWQQQQQGWSYNRVNSDSSTNSSRPRSHSPRARRRRMRPHSSGAAGVNPRPHQPWQQQLPAPGQVQHTPVLLHPLNPQPEAYQLQQSAAAASTLQGQGPEAVPPPPPPPLQWQQWQLQQQDQRANGDSRGSSSGRHGPFVDAGAAIAPDGGNSLRHAAATGAAVHQVGFDASHNGLPPPAGASYGNVTTEGSWPAFMAELHQQLEEPGVQSHQLSHLESDSGSSEEAEEWYSMSHSPLPPDARQQQQQQQPGGSNAASSSRWLRPPTPYSASETAAPEQHTPAAAAAAAVTNGPHTTAAGQVGPIGVHPPAHSGAGGSSSSALAGLGTLGGLWADSSITSSTTDDEYEAAVAPGAESDASQGMSGSSVLSTTGQAQASTAAADATAAAWGLAPQQQQIAEQQQELQRPWTVGPEALLREAPAAPPAAATAAAASSQSFRGVHPVQWRRHPLGSIDELQADPWSRYAAVEHSNGAAAAGVEGSAAAAAAAVGVEEHPEWLVRFLDDAAQQQQRWQAQVSRRRSAAAAAWRTAELSRLSEETAALLAAGVAAVDDDVDSTAATAAGSSLDGYAGAAPQAASFPPSAAELPQLARVRTAAAPARTGAALDDSPNTQLVQLMQQLQHRYEAVQQEQLNVAQQVWQQQDLQQQDLQQQREYALRRYGVLTAAGGPVSDANSNLTAAAAAAVQDPAGGDDSSNPTAAGAPYRPLQAAAASGGPGNGSSGGDGVDNQHTGTAASDNTVLLQQLLESASRSSQDVDASAMAAIAGSWRQQQQRQQQQWQQHRAPQGRGPPSQMSHSQRGSDAAAVESVSPDAAGGSGGGRVSDVGSVMRVSLESSSWQDGMPPLLDAFPDPDFFDGLTPTISSPHSFTMHPSSNLTANHHAAGLNPDMDVPPGFGPSPTTSVQQSFAGRPLGIGSPPFVGWGGGSNQVVVEGVGPVSGLLLPQSVDNMAAAAAAGMEGVGSLEQQQRLRQMMMPPPPPLVPLARGRWSSSSSIPSPMISPAVGLLPTAPGQSAAAAALRTPQASGISDQDFVTPQAAGILQQQQPPRLMPPRQQQQQWLPSPAPGWPAAAMGGALPAFLQVPGRNGPYTADNSHAAVAAAAAAASAAAGQMPGVLPGPVFLNRNPALNNGNWQQQQQQPQGMAAAVDASRVGSRVSGRRQYLQGVINPSRNLAMPPQHRSPRPTVGPDVLATAHIAAAAAAIAAAPSGVTSIRLPDHSGGLSQQQQQQWQHEWQQNVLAMQLGQQLTATHHLSAAMASSSGPAATAAAAAAAAAARQRQSELQQQMLASRTSLGGRGRSRVLGPGPLAGAGPDVMLRMMRLMGLEDPLEFEFARMFGAGDVMSYEQLIGLEDVRVVVPDHVLAQLPRRSVPPPEKPATAADGTVAEVESVICTVCQCDLGGSEPVIQLPCKHDYHESCICEWLSKYKKTCPVCKAEVK